MRARVLWLVRGLARGGAEGLLVGAAAHVDRERFEVEAAHVVAGADALVPTLEDLGVPVHGLGARGPADLRWVPRLRRLVRRGRFDLVHTHSPLPAVAARLLLGPGGPALVHTEHSPWTTYRRPLAWANAVTIGRNAAVLAVSEAVAATMRVPAGWQAGEVEVVLHGPDPQTTATRPDGRRRARAELGLPLAAPVVGTVGNLSPKKDHATLLAAVAALLPEHPEVRLVVVGWGPLEDDLRRRAQELGLAGRVTFTGARPDVADLLPGFDVFALSSRHEGLPMALVEAMAAGLVCVATDVGGVAEVMTDREDGFLVPPGDHASLAAAMGKLLHDHQLRADVGARARTRAGRFDIADAVALTEAVYDRVLARR